MVHRRAKQQIFYYSNLEKGRRNINLYLRNVFDHLFFLDFIKYYIELVSIRNYYYHKLIFFQNKKII